MDEWMKRSGEASPGQGQRRPEGQVGEQWREWAGGWVVEWVNG